MTVFNYIARSRDGKEIRATLDAMTRLDALEMLRQKGLTVVDLFAVDNQPAPKAEPKAAPAQTKPRRSAFNRSARVKMTDIAVYCRQLSISVTAGVPLREAIEGIGMELEHAVLQRVSADMVQQLSDGSSFSDAVARHPKVFNTLVQGLIRVAEETGKLPDTLKQLADYLERTDKLQRRMKAMAAYPMFIGIFFVIVSVVMTLFIMPQFTDIFADFGSELPTITKVVFGVNAFMLNNFVPIVLVVGVVFALVTFYLRTPRGAYQKDATKLRLPYAGTCVKKYLLARFCRSLSIMVHSGVPISTALEICAEASGNQVLQKSVTRVRDMILNGNRIAASLEKAAIFPGLVIRMVAVGEDSGQLPEVLENVSDLYEDQVEVSVMTSMAMFEPLIICVFGAFILTIILAIYLPIFTVSMNVH